MQTQPLPGVPVRPHAFDGLSHARLTRAMTQAKLPPAYRVLLAEIARVVPIGAWRHLSHDTLRTRLRLSESTVSRGMRALAEAPVPFIERRWVADAGRGRPGYQIRYLGPPELRRPSPAPRAESGVGTPPGAEFTPVTRDPNPDAGVSPVATPAAGIDLGSHGDPSIFYDQSCSSSSADASREAAPPPAPEPPTPAPPALPAQLPAEFARAGLLPHHWGKLRAVAPPGYDLSALAADVLKARARPDARSWFAILCRCLERREPLYSAAEVEAQNAALRALAGPPAGGGPPAAAEVPRRRPLGRAAPPPEEPPVSARPIYDHPGLSHEQRLTWLQRFRSARTPDAQRAVLAHLHAEATP
jgi:hypothetical protein